jgi:hypothetical protein
VQVAHGADLLNWHPTRDQFLFHRHDFRGIGLADDLAQLVPDCIRDFSLVEVLDDVFHRGNASASVVNQFAHDFLLHAR